MKSLLHFFVAMLLCAATSYSALGQTIISTSNYYNYWYGTHTSAVGITFIVKNNNANAIALTAVGYRAYSNDPAQLWYSATSLSGNTGVINASSTAWTSLATVAAPVVTGTIDNNFFSGFSLVIPGNTTYRFAVVTNNNIYFGSNPVTLGPYTSGGVELNTDNAMWGAANPGLSGPGYNYYGSITFSPCAYKPSGLMFSNVTSSSANLSWNAIGGSLGYQYIVSTSATPPASGFSTTTNTFYNATGLIPATTYYLHVRNKCSATSTSGWETLKFETAPPCSRPAITVSDLTFEGAKVAWKLMSHAVDYEYVINQVSTAPTGGTHTNIGSHTIKGLAEGETYYVHVKMNCQGGEFSEWALDSFRTSIICRPPAVQVDYISDARAVVYWKPMPSAYEYEYEVSQSPTPLGNGTAIKTASFYAFPLRDAEVYYFHVRSRCNDQGFASNSEWTSTSFTTFPTSVHDAGKASAVAVYPNPVSDVLTISLKDKAVGGTIRLTDMNGRALYTAVVTAAETTLNMKEHPAGIYMIRYADDAGNTEIIRVVKK